MLDHLRTQVWRLDRGRSEFHRSSSGSAAAHAESVFEDKEHPALKAFAEVRDPAQCAYKPMVKRMPQRSQQPIMIVRLENYSAAQAAVDRGEALMGPWRI